MYLKRQLITSLKPEQINEKLSKNINAPISMLTYFSFHNKKDWFGSVNDHEFTLVQGSKWYRNAMPIKVKGTIHSLPYNGGSKVEVVTHISDYTLIPFVCFLIVFLYFLNDSLSDILFMLGMFSLVIILNFYFSSYLAINQLKSELNIF